MHCPCQLKNARSWAGVSPDGAPNEKRLSGELRGPALIAGRQRANSIFARRSGFPLLFLGAGLILVPRCAGAPFQFESTGSMISFRLHHTSTLLPNGRVLVAGGVNGSYLRIASTELYNPATGAWTPASNLTRPRSDHTATLLPNGNVLVAGGFDSHGDALATVELYDPVRGTWTSSGALTTARGFHTATLLPAGNVLVAGGARTSSTVSPIARAELYNPAKGTWIDTASFKHARFLHQRHFSGRRYNPHCRRLF